MRAPARARASATARPCPGAAPRKQAIGDASKRLRELPAKFDDDLFALVERESIRVLARLEHDPSKERRADQTVALGRDCVGEEVGQALAEEGLHGVAQVVPLHERLRSEE